LRKSKLKEIILTLDEAISSRRSIRKFQSKSIPQEDIIKILCAGIDAPSGKNRQPWKFVVVQGDSKKELIEILKKGVEAEKDEDWKPWAMKSIKIINEAPTSILIFNMFGINPLKEILIDQRFQELVDIQSVGAAIENMALKATDLGIGTLWICDVFIAYEEICKWCGQDNQLVAALTMGYSLENNNLRYRKNISESVEWRS
jgi:nitroreductase